MLLRVFKLFSIIYLLFGLTSLNAADYDDDVLEIFSRLLPRFVLMSNQKLKIENQIDICVLHEDVDGMALINLLDKINNNYPNGLKNYKIKFSHNDFTNLDLCKDSELVFLFNASEKHVADTISYAKKEKIMTVSYDAKLLAKGVGLSLFLGRKIVPYINVKALQDNGILLDSLLFRISKIYTQTDK
ncbi:DUF4154 domain-containing protein [bacterium]|nr:DUF4154 domain-containing protein [bacterium]MBU1884910.1 DUF4154 domain-containing protein [bacterium]